FLIRLLEKHQPEYLGVVFDAGMSERHVSNQEYKATREKMPPELAAAIPGVRALIEAFRVPVIELTGYEADDVIGTLARQAGEVDLDTVIISGDKDFYQLIREGVSLLNPGRGGPNAVDEEWVDTRNAHERLGVAPANVVDYLGLIGDTSDNVPGVPGIGPKTAIQLIEQFGPIEEILRHSAEVPGKRAREALQGNEEIALLSKRLVTIGTDLPIALDLEALVTEEPDRPRLRQIFLDLDFHSLVRDYAAPDQPPAAERNVDYKLIRTVEEVEALVERIRAQGRDAA